MVKRGIVKIVIDLLRWSVRGIFLITTIFVSLFVCWFVCHVLIQLIDLCSNTIFSEPWHY